MIKRNILISIAILVTVIIGTIVLSRPAQAGCMGVETSIINCTGVDTVDKDGNVVKGKDATTGEEAIYNILGMVIKIMTGAIGLVATAAVVYGAILYGSAADNPENIKKAKGIWMNVVIGLIAFAFMVSILNFIIPGGVF